MTYSHCFPAWGPYGKKYMGISRIADHKFADGVRFDMTVAPSIFGFDIKVPNVTVPSGCHPWMCSNDYSIFAYRYDLEWKDKVYADVAYVKLSDESTLIRTEIVNNSEIMQNCLVNYFSSVEYPANSYVTLALPKKCAYINAVDYKEYFYKDTRPWDEQNPDGYKKGEFIDKHFVDNKGLGDRVGKWHMPHKYQPPFGAVKGDTVKYTIPCTTDYSDAVLAIRYRTSDIKYEKGQMVGVNLINSENTSSFTLNGKIKIDFEPCDDLKIKYIPIGKINKGDFDIALIAEGTGAVEFDFLCICEKCDADKIITEDEKYDFMPEITEKKCSDNGYISTCKYKDIDGDFTLRTFDNNTRYRKIETGALEDCLTARLSNSDVTFDDVTESFTGTFSRKHSDDGFFHNTIVHTVFVNPDSREVIYTVLSKGAAEYLTCEEYEKIYNERLSEAEPFSFNKDGKKYELSNNILKATVLTNTVYPIYKHGEYIIHHTPGKRWDCLYTWDSGFIGLGLADYARKFSEYSLDTYFSSDDNPDYAFLHHGSPVPVQMYLYLELLNRSDDKSDLLSMYPRAKLYYDFLAGKTRGSTTARFKSGITSTYDYFYSSSGMDDYPPQVAMMNRDIRDTTTPVISVSQVIRCGKILKMIASKLGKNEDVKTYTEDIEKFTSSLNKYSWDSESGYFSYVLHDKNYNPTGFLRTENGENLNKGLDGIYPIIADACNDEQQKAILSHLKSEKEMLSPYGISAVDMTAGYFIVNGYWNGNVWFPHQWFIWKAMLDLGENDFAFTIAEKALNIWKREVDYTYYTFEMVSVVTGRGGWFHNFGGLSTPINMWAEAYYKPGEFNSGFDLWIDKSEFSDNNTKFNANVTYFGNKEKFTAVAVMNDDEKINYKVTLDGEEVPFTERSKGTIEISLSIKDSDIHTLKIS